jgi:hypothetical protein
LICAGAQDCCSTVATKVASGLSFVDHWSVRIDEAKACKAIHVLGNNGFNELPVELEWLTLGDDALRLGLSAPTLICSFLAGWPPLALAEKGQRRSAGDLVPL